MTVNCGALPDTLLESELFGYKAGAFTGAARDKPGRFLLAQGGTIFLDEIGEMSPALQVKLLRVLQEKTFEPLGATETQTADVRVITATNRDLATQMSRGDFREDLFYRVNVMKVELPPLRKRKEDIPMLTEQLIKTFNVAQNKEVTGMSPDVLSVLMAHDYPGNVRELQNILEHAFVLCHEGMIELKHLPGEIVPTSVEPVRHYRLRDAVREIEIQSIREALERNNNNRLAAARELGIHKSTLFRKAKLLGLELPEEDGRSRGK